jgi:hypothetical protein
VEPLRGSDPGPGVGPAAGALLAAGVVVALVVTVAVFSADDPRFLRPALVAVCWAFLVVAFLAAGRRAEQVAAGHRETELRRAFDLQVEREVAARLDHHLGLESRQRRDAEQAVRNDLAQLRAEFGSLTQLRAQSAAVTQVGSEPTGLAELRSDLGRLREELTGQRTGELLIERTVMRAQSVRVPVEHGGDDGRTLDGDRWRDPWAEARGSGLPADAHPAAGTAATSLVESTRPLERIGDSRPAAGPMPSEPSPAGNEPSWTLDPQPALAAEETPVPSGEEPPVPAAADTPAGQRGGSTAPTGDDAPVAAPSQEAGSARLAAILAANPAGATSGGRRRRRYRDEEGGEPADDVLARVLGRPVSPSAR